MNKKIISLISAAVMLLTATGCTPKVASAKLTTPEQPDVYYFDRFGDEVMPIGGYVGPTAGFGYNGNYMPSQITDYHYKQVSDCGLNFVTGMNSDYKINAQDVLDGLYYADKNDVMYFVQDTYLYEVDDESADDPSKWLNVTLEEYQERVSIYSSSPAFAGLEGRDEPFANMFPQMQKILEYFNATFDNNKILYMNSNSYQCPSNWFGGGPNGTAEEAAMDIDGYMTAWFESFPSLGYYSYDTYPFITNEPFYIRPDIMENYSKVREYSQRYGVPFWTFMQAGGEWGGKNDGWRVPTEGECLWQVSTALAFGAKGYTWYPYNIPPETMSATESCSALVGRAGQKLEPWYHAQKANMQTRACDHILMKSVYKGLIHVLSGKADSTNKCEIPAIETNLPDVVGGKFREVTHITGDNSITGCFNYQGRTMLYVVNNSVENNNAKVYVHLDDTYKATVIQRAKEHTVTGNVIELTFAAGEGACIVLN